MSAPHLTTLPNLRDLGGLATAQGTQVLEQRIFRSVELGRLSDADLTSLNGLGLKTVVDLRTSAERDGEPDVVPAGADDIHIDILADMNAGTHTAGPEKMAELFKDPAATTELLGDGRAEEIFAQTYEGLVKLPSAQQGYTRYLQLLERDGSDPLLFHCTTGKDRTGWAAAITLTLLGVPREQVTADYLRTNDDLLPALQGLLDQFAAAGGDPDLLRPVLGVERAYLDRAFATVEDSFGSFDAYLHDALGVDDAMRQRLVSRYTA